MVDICKDCGICCKKFGAYSNEKYALWSGAVPGLYLFPWEFRKLKTKKMDVAFQVFPDAISKRNIVTGYIVKNSPCVFYNGKCNIYKKRPLTCIAYPHFSDGMCNDCPKRSIFKANNKCIAAAKKRFKIFLFLVLLINKSEKQGKIRIIYRKKNWKLVDVDKFFKNKKGLRHF
jgi:Fe-S-cluster containining protein